MTYFVSSALLTEVPCYKFMLKHDSQIYFLQFMKILDLCFQWNYCVTVFNLNS